MFKECRLAAQSCKDEVKRAALRHRTDECKEVFDRFNLSASREDMEALVAAWTRMVRALDRVAPLPDGDPAGAGRLRAPGTTFVHDPDIYDALRKVA